MATERCKSKIKQAIAIDEVRDSVTATVHV